MIKELLNPNTDNYKDFKKVLLSNTMPWFYHDKTVPESPDIDMPFFSHALLSRPQHENNGVQVPAVSSPNSVYFEKCYFILKEILDFNNINFDVVYRMNLNLTLHNALKESLPHTDLNLPHKVLIIYLNKFKNGKTIVLDKNNKKFYSNPKEDGVIGFDGKLLHYHETPELHEKRLVMVANFQ